MRAASLTLRCAGMFASKTQEPGKYGDMRVEFDVRFPLNLTAEQRDALRQQLQQYRCQYDLAPRTAPMTF